jgi:3-hydroxyisobutyrate dehydrogenase-like beta-hydroxyacid dehydrogenase
VAELAGGCDAVSICMPAYEHVRRDMWGPDGIDGGEHPALTVLIHSTVHPDTMREMHALGAAWDVAVHDACVTGGEVAAKEGSLAIFVSEVDRLSPRARHALEVYGERIIDTGPPGSGAAVKIGVNVKTFAEQAAVAAAFELVSAQGASTDALVEAWRHNEQYPPMIDRFSALLGFSPEALAGMRGYLSNVVSIEQKDLSLALDLGQGTRSGPSPVIAAVRDQLPVVFGIEGT